jgi:hypothetical protein
MITPPGKKGGGKMSNRSTGRPCLILSNVIVLFLQWVVILNFWLDVVWSHHSILFCILSSWPRYVAEPLSPPLVQLSRGVFGNFFDVE